MFPTLNRDDGLLVKQPTLTRWRWYHFYFMLAFFDLLVIGASLWLYHDTLRSYEVALDGLKAIDDRQQWVTSLRLTLIELNAPGNDVFETQNVGAERVRFEQSRDRLKNLLTDEGRHRLSLGEFRSEVEAMTTAEEQIFRCFDTMSNRASPTDAEALLTEAARSMAAMDRSQAKALASLAEAERSLSREKNKALEAYGAKLARSAAVEKWFLLTVALILIGVFLYGRKLQRTHEQMLQDQQRAAEERHARLAAVGEVCSAVAHGIRNPLAAITSSAQLALEFGTLDDTTKLRLHDVLDESRRLNRRVTRLLDFSRGAQRSFEAVDLREVIDQAVHSVKFALGENRVELHREVESAPLIVHGDREGLVQSLIELLSNSIEQLTAGGTIRLVCRRLTSEISCVGLSVIDNGPGIPEGLGDRVFELFMTSKADGHGIGLASVKRVVELHGGKVNVEASPGPGAHIRIVLPLEGTDDVATVLRSARHL